MDWLFDRLGNAILLVVDDRFVDSGGHTIGWIGGVSAYSLSGDHIGWFEDGVLYDSTNSAIGFTRDAVRLPSRPAIGGSPGIPGLAGVPGRPGLSESPGRPGYRGWSDLDLASFFPS